MRAVLILLLLLPSLAMAGPWPREKGQVFLAFSSSVTAQPTGPSSYYSLYFEYGATDTLTIGVDAGMDHLGHGAQFVFARKPIIATDRPWRYAASLGLGQVHNGSRDTAVLGGLSLGRGFESKLGGGWFVVDAQTQFRDSGLAALKADITLGLRPRPKIKTMMQLQTGAYPGLDPYLRVAPSVVFATGKHAHIELGANLGVLGGKDVAAKIGSWIEF